MASATVGSLKSNSDARPFFLTRGSFSGTPSNTPAQAHTNNDRTWDSLYYGLASTLRSQMFGMTLSGSDVCGYNANGDLDQELCLRWYQMATFFPLARHSQDQSANAPRTEPFNFKDAGM
jgi:alpha-glucosidase